MNSVPSRSPTRLRSPLMVSWLSRILAVGSACVGIRAGLTWALPFRVVREVLDRRAGDGSADLYTHALHGRVSWACTVVLCVMLVGVIALLAYRRRISSGVKARATEASRLYSSLIRSFKIAWPSLLVVCVVAFLIRWPYIDLPMRFDESYTYLNYSSQPLYVTVSKYDAPNNHILHSVLEWLSIRIGGHAPIAIRIPALVCGVLTAAVAAWWGVRRGGREAGLVTGCLVATSSMLVEYSVNARGYTLVHLLLLLLWIMIEEWAQSPCRFTLGIISLLVALTIWAMPVALYGVIVLGCVAWGTAPGTEPLTTFRHRRWELVLAGGIAVGLTLCLYSPVLLVFGVHAVAAIGQGTVAEGTAGGQGFVISMREGLVVMGRDQPLAAWVMLIGGLGLSGWSRSDTLRATARWSAIGLVVCLGVITLQRVIPPGRSWLFVWPLACCLSVSGYGEGLSQTQLRRGVLMGLLGVGAVWPGVRVLSSDSIVQSNEAAICREAQAIIHELAPQLERDEPVIAVSPTSSALAYYAIQHRLPANHFFRPQPQSTLCRAFVVASRDPDQTVGEILEALSLTAMFGQHRIESWKEYPSARVYRLTPVE